MIFACFNDREDRSFVLFVSHYFYWLFMTSTKWFALGSFSLSTVLAYVGGFAGSAFVERQVTTESTAPEIVATENRSSTYKIHLLQRSLDDVPLMKESMYRALSIGVSLILLKQEQRPPVH